MIQYQFSFLKLIKAPLLIEDLPDNSPRLWVFMLIILGVLGSFILTASLISRLLQRRRRRSLLRRIESGEVDLEMLGIRNLRASQAVLDKMPLYYYGNSEHGVDTTSSPQQALQEENKGKRMSLHPPIYVQFSLIWPNILLRSPTLGYLVSVYASTTFIYHSSRGWKL